MSAYSQAVIYPTRIQAECCIKYVKNMSNNLANSAYRNS